MRSKQTVRLAITGVGMVSSVGHNAPQTCAAVRAGIAGFAELEGVVGRTGVPVIAARLPSEIERKSGENGFFQTCFAACREALSGFDPSWLEARSVTWSVLTKEDGRAGGPGVDADTLAPLLAGAGWCRRWQLGFYRSGNAAGAEALADAQARLAEDPVAIEVIWGLDRLTDLGTLCYLEASDRLKGPHQGRGLIPGEASACVVLETPGLAAQNRRRSICDVVAVGTGNEHAQVADDSPCLGEGLTSAIRRALAAARWDVAGVLPVWCDLNGEIYRAHEWMLALCRTLDDVDVVHPADCLGDVGAASIPLLLGLASTALDRGYANANRGLVFSSSDFGIRGAVCLEANHHQGPS